MDLYVEIEEVVSLYLGILNFSFPITIVFGLGNVLVTMFLSAAFSGRLKLGGKF